MQKFSKNSKNVKKATKKSINLRYCTVLYLSWGLQGFAKIFTQIYFKKMPFCTHWHFLFSENHIFALKNSPPGELWIVL